MYDVMTPLGYLGGSKLIDTVLELMLITRGVGKESGASTFERRGSDTFMNMSMIMSNMHADTLTIYIERERVIHAISSNHTSQQGEYNAHMYKCVDQHGRTCLEGGDHEGR